MRKRAGDRGHRHEEQEPSRAEAARDRRPERDQPNRVEQDVGPRTVQKGISQKRPRLRAAAQHMQFPDLSRLLQRGRVGVHAVEQINQPIWPDGDGEPARNERVIPDDPVLDRLGGPIEGGVDSDKNDDEAKDHNGRVEHRFAAAHDAARLVCAHIQVQPFGHQSRRPRNEAGTDAGPDSPRPKTSLNRRRAFSEFGVRPTARKAPFKTIARSSRDDSVAGRTECA